MLCGGQVNKCCDRSDKYTGCSNLLFGLGKKIAFPSQIGEKDLGIFLIFYLVPMSLIIFPMTFSMRLHPSSEFRSISIIVPRKSAAMVM